MTSPNPKQIPIYVNLRDYDLKKALCAAAGFAPEATDMRVKNASDRFSRRIPENAEPKPIKSDDPQWVDAARHL